MVDCGWSLRFEDLTHHLKQVEYAGQPFKVQKVASVPVNLNGDLFEKCCFGGYVGIRTRIRAFLICKISNLQLNWTVCHFAEMKLHNSFNHQNSFRFKSFSFLFVWL